MSVHFSSKTDLWSTPKEFFIKLHEEFIFNTDVCASDDNALLPHYFTKETDVLKQDWKGVCWMNPPYGREIGAWMKKAHESSKSGVTVVCLVPARTDTNWWHNYAMQHEIRFIKGRLKFGNSKNSAPFPSAVVVMKRIYGKD